jgi:hypothetical protein
VYYYSPSENAFAVELADGSDPREFGTDVLSQIPIVAGGPGWSPNGEWFAFSIFPNNQVPSGFAVHLSNTERVRTIENFAITRGIYWSPDGRYLLVAGNQDPCNLPPQCSRVTYWLIDVEDDVVLAWLDFRFGERSPGQTPVEWSLENGQVTFYEKEAFPNAATTLTSYYRITMRDDGTVVKQPITREEWQSLFNEEESLPNYGEVELVSPSGRYLIVDAPDELTDTQSGDVVELPAPEFDLPGAVRLVAAQWDASEEWVLLGYNVWSGGVDAVSVVNVDGTGYRELTTCGFAPACVGWLPDNVDVAQIPSAAD